MSAISAGMLIYASTVEMLAGDFVFGDLADEHHRHSDGGALGDKGQGADGHDDGYPENSSYSDGGPEHMESDRVWGREEDEGERRKGHGGLWRKIVAVMSLLAGVTAMELVGLGE